MRYKVIGWTYSGEGRYKSHGNVVTMSVSNAIIEDIRKHKYCFGGDRQYDYAPILNDGTCVYYSSRGWGGVMAKAYGVEGDYAYMTFYMDEYIPSKFPKKFPDVTATPDEESIVPRESLIDIFEMTLDDGMFDKVKAGTKNIEVRLFDEKRQQVDIGDYIKFVKASDRTQYVRRRVVDYDCSRTFEKRLSKLRFSDDGKTVIELRYAPESLGFPAGTTLKEAVNAMYKYYSESDEMKYGVVTYVLQKPSHTCRTKLSVWMDWYCLLDRANHDTTAYLLGEDDIEYEDMTGDEDYHQNIEADIEALVGDEDDMEVMCRRVIEIGNNEIYNRDVNVMIRKTLKNLYGKEDRLKAVFKKYCIYATLDVVALVDKDAEDPKPNLNIDSDIQDFLDRTGVELKLLTYEI